MHYHEGAGQHHDHTHPLTTNVRMATASTDTPKPQASQAARRAGKHPVCQTTSLTPNTGHPAQHTMPCPALCRCVISMIASAAEQLVRVWQQEHTHKGWCHCLFAPDPHNLRSSSSTYGQALSCAALLSLKGSSTAHPQHTFKLDQRIKPKGSIQTSSLKRSHLDHPKQQTVTESNSGQNWKATNSKGR